MLAKYEIMLYNKNTDETRVIHRGVSDSQKRREIQCVDMCPAV